MSAAADTLVAAWVPWAATALALAAGYLLLPKSDRAVSIWRRFNAWANRPAVEAQRREWVKAGNVERRQVKR